MRKADSNDFQLTKRELQILELTAHGLSAKEIAQIIHIAPRTVEGYINTIRIKLQARNRAHMVAKALAARLIVLDRHREHASATNEQRPLLKIVNDKWPATASEQLEQLLRLTK